MEPRSPFLAASLSSWSLALVVVWSTTAQGACRIPQCRIACASPPCMPLVRLVPGNLSSAIITHCTSSRSTLSQSLKYPHTSRLCGARQDDSRLHCPLTCPICACHRIEAAEMTSHQPYMYAAEHVSSSRFPDKPFDPKAVTRASWEPKPQKPKQEGPLLSFNRHPE